ncbi:hypothetical protein AQUCO_04700041v1 [Aquilegia coerulea]|uniref:Uncharacterized protein n=1 Tax=Aquilegia coerulea TaxID=218851 RepID=A0A2G5CKU5_AQUCA|nr:hypothetical protein AQUCO_04700041v1 [Aquilegia coerulea]
MSLVDVNPFEDWLKKYSTKALSKSSPPKNISVIGGPLSLKPEVYKRRRSSIETSRVLPPRSTTAKRKPSPL